METKNILTHIKKRLLSISYLLNQPYEIIDLPDTFQSLTNVSEIELFEEYQRLLIQAIEINFSLPKPQVCFLTIADIKQKDFIDVKEFEKLYGYGKSWQAQRRSRIHTPLPKVSQHSNKVLYDRIEVDNWFKNEILT